MMRPWIKENQKCDAQYSDIQTRVLRYLYCRCLWVSKGIDKNTDKTGTYMEKHVIVKRQADHFYRQFNTLSCLH